MAIKCDYAPCSTELSDTTIKNFILDSVNENYAGFYCSNEHAGYDIIKSVFSNPSTFITNAVNELGLNINGAAAQAAPNFNNEPVAAPIPEAIDADLDLITNVNQQAAQGGNLPNTVPMAVVANEQLVKETANKLNADMASLIQNIMTVSSTNSFPLGKNVVPDSYVADGVVLERMIYSIYSIDPSFTFNVVYEKNFISFMFADDMYNFKITELDKVFNDVQLTATSLYKKIESIIKDVNGIVDIPAAPITEEPLVDDEIDDLQLDGNLIGPAETTIQDFENKF